MTPVWQSALEACLGLGALASATASVALARRAGSCRAAREELAGRVDELSVRLRSIESRVLPPGGLPASLGRVDPSPCPPPQGGRVFPIPSPLEGEGRAGGEVGSRSDVGRGSTRIDPPQPPSPPLIAVPSLAMEGSGELANQAGAELGRRFGSVWALADAGESPRAIARATGHPVGQVELILGLRPVDPIPPPQPPEGRPAVPRG